jgi:hypothetical protein
MVAFNIGDAEGALIRWQKLELLQDAYPEFKEF